MKPIKVFLAPAFALAMLGGCSQETTVNSSEEIQNNIADANIEMDSSGDRSLNIEPENSNGEVLINPSNIGISAFDLDCSIIYDQFIQVGLQNPQYLQIRNFFIRRMDSSLDKRKVTQIQLNDMVHQERDEIMTNNTHDNASLATACRVTYQAYNP